MGCAERRANCYYSNLALDKYLPGKIKGSERSRVILHNLIDLDCSLGLVLTLHQENKQTHAHPIVLHVKNDMISF